MTTNETIAEVKESGNAVKHPRGRRISFGFGKWLLPFYVIIAFVFLLIPIAYTFIFSFNDYNKSNIVWRGFTLKNWLNVCDNEVVCVSFGNSLLIGVTATIAATVLGTMIALALVRYRFRFRSSISLLLFLPMATPEVVLGAGLATEFLAAGVQKGIVTVMIAHTMFCVSFVVVTVKARISTLDPALEEAGRDLYGSPAQVFWRITFPLLLPGVVAAALLSFALSFDDFIITYFNSGNIDTFPTYIYTAAARGIPAEANVIASAVFLLAMTIVLITQIRSAAKRKRLLKGN